MSRVTDSEKVGAFSDWCSSIFDGTKPATTQQSGVLLLLLGLYVKN